MLISHIGTTARGGRIYQCGWEDLQDLDKVDCHKRNIMLVLMASDVEFDSRYWVDAAKVLHHTVYCGIVDGPPGVLTDDGIIGLAMMCRAWIKRGNDVIFNCFMGRSRSSYASIATVMVTLGVTFDRGLEAVRATRPEAKLMPCFEEHLRKLEPRFLDMASV